MKEKKLLLIDGNSIAYKAYFALSKYKFTNSAGLHTNAIYGFALMMDSVLTRLSPTHILVAFDAGKTTFRTEKFSGYKGGRPSTEPELAEQFLPLRQMVEAMGIRYYELPNYEADDIIGTYAKQASAQGFSVVVISGDKDLTQLASEDVCVEISKKGVTDIENYTPETMQEKMGIAPCQVTDLKGLMGDKSDNIPGVTKVGEKTALRLLEEYGTIENLYAHIEELKASKLKENLIQDKEMAFLSKDLATIITDAPVAYPLEDLAYSGYNEAALTAFYKENGFISLLEKIEGEKVVDLEEVPFEEVTEFSLDFVEKEATIHFEMLEGNYHLAQVDGISWTCGEKNYVAKPTLLTQQAFIDYLENAAYEKVVFDAKATLVVLLRQNIHMQGIVFDELLASYLLDLLDKYLSVASMAKQYQRAFPSKRDFYGKPSKRCVPEWAIFSDYLAKKIRLLQDLREKLDADLEKTNQKELLYTIELPLAKVLAKMEHTGIAVERETLEKMEVEFEATIKNLTTRIYEQAGEEFNLNSPQQLSKLLFETLGFDYKKYSKKTKTGYSTNAEVLEKMSAVAPIVQDILTYREISKLQSTYVMGLQSQIHEDGKIHTRYQQALTQTGRLSSIDPNLQNIPIRTDLGRKIRQAFVPSQEDWVIYSADYSQIELRVVAAVSDDAHLKEAFVRGEDIHTSTAMRVFGIENAADVAANDRRNAKAVNFGVVYGISEWGLSKNLDINAFKAKTFIEKYFEKYPGIKTYMETVVAFAQKNGFVETLFHRRRTLPEINDRNFKIRGFAERQAINTPIQGSATDILKIAMNELDKQLEQTDIKAHMLLQVHDELIFEVAKSDVEKLDKLVRTVMEETVKLSVPLVVESSWGKTWYEAK